MSSASPGAQGSVSSPGALLNILNFTAQPVALASISNGSPGVLTVLSAAQLPENGSPLQLTTTGGLPTGLALLTTYYVINASGTTFNASATQGGSAINTSSAGSGTHTMNSIYVKGSASFVITEVWGAGGGGGAGGATINMAPGGGAGGYARQKILAAAISATETITIGAGGTAGATPGGAGGTGGTSSFGAHSSATGGGGGAGGSAGATTTAPGAGGAGASGDINLVGNPGGSATEVNATAAAGASGFGGQSSLGGAGVAIVGNVGAGSAGVKNSGSGGSGGSNSAGGSGGLGGSGRVIVYEYS